MKVFVTGAIGVLGQAVVPQLIQADHQVYGLVRSDANMTLMRRLGGEPIRVDLFDRTSLQVAITGCQAICHLATNIPPTRTIRRLSAWTTTDRIRREGTHHLIEAARAQNIQTFIGVLRPRLASFRAISSPRIKAWDR